MVFYPAEYVSAGLRALDSCSTGHLGAADLGAVLEYVHIASEILQPAGTAW